MSVSDSLGLFIGTIAVVDFIYDTICNVSKMSPQEFKIEVNYDKK